MDRLATLDEPGRLEAVRRYEILDTPPDGAFDRITALAARLFDVPISIVSIVDTDRIWFKSHHGLEVEQIDREPGLCASAILQYDPWLVTDASVDSRTLANPLVAGSFGLRFYAGVPLTTRDGYNLGTLCVIDRNPRAITTEDVETLKDLASVVMDELELRLSARRTLAMEERLRRGAEEVARALQESLLPPTVPEVPGLELEARYHVANREQVGGDFYDVIPDEDGCAVVVGDACGKGTRAASMTSTARWALRAVASGPWTPSEALGRLNHVMLTADDNPERYCTLAVAKIRPHAEGADVTVALGGHPNPLAVRVDGTIMRLGERAPLVGWERGVRFSDTTHRLASGDVLVMLTDGLFEAIGGHGTVDDGPVCSLLESCAGLSAREVADRLDAHLPAQQLRDDAAFLVVRCR